MSQSIRQRRVLRQYVNHGKPAAVPVSKESASRSSLRALLDYLYNSLRPRPTT